MTKCGQKTKKGGKCKNLCVDGMSTCKIHTEISDEVSDEVSKKLLQESIKLQKEAEKIAEQSRLKYTEYMKTIKTTSVKNSL